MRGKLYFRSPVILHLQRTPLVDYDRENCSISCGIIPSAVFQQASRWIPFLVSRKTRPINMKSCVSDYPSQSSKENHIFVLFCFLSIFLVKRPVVLFLTMKSVCALMSNANASGPFFPWVCFLWWLGKPTLKMSFLFSFKNL